MNAFLSLLHRGALALALGLSILSSPALAAEEARPRNRLAQETSPYLLLHAANPVDWYPWGPEALAKAKAENKLIFLSIGYSSCHWCHVMERESFMDPEIAALLNKHFVAIKVDREERPDLDEIYMTALQLYYQLIGTPQAGGWPLSMFLTPDGNPIAGGTYFPPRDREGFDGFLTVLGRVQSLWETEPERVAGSAERLAGFVRQTLLHRPVVSAELPGLEVLDELQDALAEEFDPEHGGFGFSAERPRRPKFPQPPNLVFLLERVRRDGDPQARTMLVTTLEKMAAGGIRDHLGGGFHRYSTDRFWHIPHFEKMLYDNAQLATVYAEAYRLTGRDDFHQVTAELADFVLREMTSPEGGFYSALDAQTEGEEGRYYAWEPAEVRQALGEDQWRLAAEVYGLDGPANFEGKYVLLLREPPAETARKLNLQPQQLQERLKGIRARLLEARNQRPRPLTDTKVLASWNGLMIRGLADAGRLLEEPRYRQAAARAAEFVLEKLQTDEGRLRRSYAGGKASLNGYLDDYALLADGLIALHEATGDERWLREADRITQAQIEWFWDDRGGGFFFTSRDHEELIARSKDLVDSSLPSGNSVAAANLIYLAGALKKPDYRERAEQTLKVAAPLVNNSPASVPRWAVARAALLDAQRGN